MAPGIHTGTPTASPVCSVEESFREKEECVRRASYSASRRARGEYDVEDEDEAEDDDEDDREYDATTMKICHCRI